MKTPPKAFMQGGHRFTVEMVSPRKMKKLLKALSLDNSDAYGLFVPDRLAIFLLKPSKVLDTSVVMQAFWHEYAHAMLWVKSDKCWENEKYVDAIGHQLHQLHQTAEY